MRSSAPLAALVVTGAVALGTFTLLGGLADGPGDDPATVRGAAPVASGQATDDAPAGGGEAGGGDEGGAPAPSRTTDDDAPSGSITLAFAGDVHFEGVAAGGLEGDLGSATDVLTSADLSFVNLETAVTTGGSPEPKKYTFRTPPKALTVLKDAGVDAVSMANNHGLDYGRTGLEDSLAAERQTGMPLVGIGANADEAYAPWTTEVDGLEVAVLAASDVLDSFAIPTWPALDDRPGIAQTKDGDRFLEAVRAADADADVVVVVVHWGRERVVCPTERQVELAGLLAEAGADVVAGSHAHVLQPEGRVGDAAVHYGLGNYHWYAKAGPSSETGVWTVTVSADGVEDTAWTPARIASGSPEVLTGSQGAQALAAQEGLASRCG